MSRRPRVCTALLVVLLAFAIVLLAHRPAEAQETPLIVEADQVVYDQQAQQVEATGNVRLRYRGLRLFADHAVFDLQREYLTADGHVILIDAAGRELRGERLTYDVRLDLADVQRGETIVDRVYVRSERLRVEPGRITAADAMVTTCDPASPAVRVTAQRIEVRPGDRLIATRATLWAGRFRVLTLPILVISLRSGEDTVRSFPRIGYNNVDGFWVEYVYGYGLGPLPAALYTKYGTRTGFIVRHTLTYRRPPFALELTIGRNQDVDMQIFDQAEAVLSTDEQRLGSLPLLYTAFIRSGWFEETTTGIRTSRTQYGVGVRTTTLALGPRTSWQARMSWSDASYGTGARQGIFRASLGVTHQMAPRQSLALNYDIVDVTGGTPFAFDAIAVEDRINKVILLYTRTGERQAATTTLFGGPGYNFRDATPSVILGYGERVADRYHWMLTGEYNLGTRDLKLTADAGIRLGHGTYATVQAIYHTLSKTYEDLDYILTSRVCECVEISLKYRQVRQEIWLEVGLTGFPQSRLQLQFPGP